MESGLLTIGLWACREQIWDTYSSDEKEVIVSYLKGYAYGNTVNQNWRLFNLLMLAFLEMCGYEQDREYIKHLVTEVLLDYAGDGWYRDGQHIDYYSCWSYQIFLPLFNLWYGYEHLPETAGIIERYSNELIRNYSLFFDARGRMIMWGRSIIYRNAATVPLIGNLMLRHSEGDPAEIRNICTGALAQFVNHDRALSEKMLTLGFYGEYTPAVQPYSCAESPFWMFMSFLCLLFNDNHPFWTEQSSEETEKNMTTKVLDGPGLAVSRLPANSSSLLRTGKVLFSKKEQKHLWSYSRLCFSSAYPWEKPLADGTETMQYSLLNRQTEKIETINCLLWGGEQGNVLYRRGMFSWTLEKEWHWCNVILLADMVVPKGILRFDLPQLLSGDYTLTLGSYGFPYRVTGQKILQNNGWTAVIIQGRDEQHHKHAMAMTINGSWTGIEVRKSKGTSPVREESMIIAAEFSSNGVRRTAWPLLITQILTSEDNHVFTEEELFPVTDVFPAAAGTGYDVRTRGQTLHVDYSHVQYSMQL